MPILTAEERIGTRLAGKYRLDRILGRGGFGVVFAGVHELTGREIATKVLNHDLGEQEAFVNRFLQEARAAAALNHPNVVDVLDLGKDPDGTVFIVLELLSGQDLSSIIAERAPLPVDETLSYLLPVMDALAKAHEQGIVHRDLKPDNIFLNVNSKGEMHPKLLDFGIAKMAGGGAGMTSTGMIIGTPHYMAPEQARGLKDIGPPADVWSMGIVLWQCLCAGVPFDAGTPTGVLGAILTTRAPTVRTVAPHLPPHIALAIDAALVYEADNRLQNMGELVAALKGEGASLPAMSHAVRVQEGPSAASRPTPPTVNMAMTPVPGGLTPMPGVVTPPPMHTPTGTMTAPKSKSGLVMGVAAAAALLLAGIGVVAGVALWPTEADPAPPELASPAPPSTTTPPAASEPPAPPQVPVAVAEPAPTPAVAAPAEPTAEAETAEPEAEDAEDEAEDAPSEPVAARHGSRRSRPRIETPVPRPLAPAPTPRPLARPHVGTQGAPILR
ncbi:MAG: serine/threonine protein kinase [Sandaracinaceae bacterium]|nr:serine/threonine protein kinase [Sandaracinaceae bacterium]